MFEVGEQAAAAAEKTLVQAAAQICRCTIGPSAQQPRQKTWRSSGNGYICEVPLRSEDDMRRLSRAGHAPSFQTLNVSDRAPE